MAGCIGVLLALSRETVFFVSHVWQNVVEASYNGEEQGGRGVFQDHQEYLMTKYEIYI